MVCAWWWSSYREPMMLGWCPLTQRARYVYKYMCACVCVFNSDVFWANARCSKLEANWIQSRRARSPLSALSIVSLILSTNWLLMHTALLTASYTNLTFLFHVNQAKSAACFGQSHNAYGWSTS
jgi:hypothetical protein